MESLRAKAKEARLATDLYKATSAGNVAQLTEMLVATKAKADGATTRAALSSNYFSNRVMMSGTQTNCSVVTVHSLSVKEYNVLHVASFPLE